MWGNLSFLIVTRKNESSHLNELKVNKLGSGKTEVQNYPIMKNRKLFMSVSDSKASDISLFKSAMYSKY